MVSTGRHHGFESHAEQQLLLVLDFAGELIEVLSQPFRLTFISADGPGDHIPDFLAVTRAGSWLIDVRPGERIKAEDRVRFAAASEIALSCGWRYVVVPGWLPHVQEGPGQANGVRRAGGRDRGSRDGPGAGSASDLGPRLGVDLAVR
jgi:hypothetical protein